MNNQKHIEYKFTDGSEICIDNNQQATIIGSTKQFAYSLWRTCAKDQSLKNHWTAIFIKVADTLHQKHGIVLEHTDYSTGITVNHFENLINS